MRPTGRWGGVAAWVALACALGCGEPTVVRRGEAPAVARGGALALRRVGYDELRVGPQFEPAYLATLTEEERRTFARDKQLLADAYAARLEVACRSVQLERSEAEGRSALRARVELIRLGGTDATGLLETPTEVTMLVSVLRADGSLAEEVRVTTSVYRDALLPDQGARLMEAARRLADQTAAFLDSTTAP